MRLLGRMRNTWWIGACGLMLFASGQAFAADSPPRHGETYKLDLNRRVDRYEVKDAAMIGVLQNLVVHGVSVGAEVADYRGLKVSLSLRNSSLREVLDVLVAKLPGYEWKFANGIVKIYPSARQRETTALRLLDQTIPSFSSTGLGVTDTVAFLAQVARSHGISAAPGVGVSSAAWADAADRTPVDAKLDINIDHTVTLREALNGVVIADPPAFWVAFPMPDGRLALTGDTGHSHQEESSRNKKLREGRKPGKGVLPGPK